MIVITPEQRALLDSFTEAQQRQWMMVQEQQAEEQAQAERARLDIDGGSLAPSQSNRSQWPSMLEGRLTAVSRRQVPVPASHVASRPTTASPQTAIDQVTQRLNQAESHDELREAMDAARALSSADHFSFRNSSAFKKAEKR
jgi:hypothetical protein